MLMELLSKAAMVAMLSIVVSSMLAMGAGLTVSQISEPLRNARLVLLALFANFVLMPLGALALAKVLWLHNPFAVGLLVLGCSSARPARRSCRTCQGQPRICRYAAHRRNILDDVRARLKDSAPAA
jgi:hypothetical protein